MLGLDLCVLRERHLRVFSFALSFRPLLESAFIVNKNKAMPKRLLSICRFIVLLAHMAWGVMVLIFVVGPDPNRRNDRDWRAIHNWMARLRRILGIRVSVEGAAIQGPVLFVSNHITWYDIPVLQSIIPTGFVGKAEIRRWPVIGW